MISNYKKFLIKQQKQRKQMLRDRKLMVERIRNQASSPLEGAKDVVERHARAPGVGDGGNSPER